MNITILALEDTSESQLLRLQLEAFGVAVRLTGLGSPSEFFAGFDFYGSAPDVVILCGHGDEGGFIFPEIAEGVDELVLAGNRIDAGLIAERLSIASTIVVSTACATGTEAIAEAFLGAGAAAYIAPAGYPEGGAIGPLLGLAFYMMISAELEPRDAFSLAGEPFAPENRLTVWVGAGAEGGDEEWIAAD